MKTVCQFTNKFYFLVLNNLDKNVKDNLHQESKEVIFLFLKKLLTSTINSNIPFFFILKWFSYFLFLLCQVS